MAAAEALRVLNGPSTGQELPIGGELLFGRDAGTVRLDGDNQLSRRHARIARNPEGSLVLEDLGSTNGTFLNGWRIPVPQFLAVGDRIQIGGTVLELIGTMVVTGRRSAIISGVHGQVRPPAAESVLYVTGVKKSYGDHSVLKGVDLEIQPGEIVGLLGPNGAGKTSLVSIIAGLRSADEGSVYINGVDALANPSEARLYLGIAPQDLGIYPTLSVEQNLKLFGELNGLGGRLLRARVAEVADALSLTPLLKRRAGTLSGGQKRRLHTGMAMLHHPALLILDEPTVGADVRTRQEILDAVKALATEGRAICYSTHYLPEIEELGASVAILDGGQIVARGSIAELIRECATAAVEVRFQGPAPQIRAQGKITITDSLIRLETDTPDQAAGDLLNRLPPDAPPVASVEVIRPSLDSVYLALSNKHYAEVQPVPYVPGQGLTPLAGAPL